MKKISVILVALVSQAVMAADQPSTLMPLSSAQEPMQQLLNPQEPTQQLLTPQEPVQQLLSPQEPTQQLLNAPPAQQPSNAPKPVEQLLNTQKSMQQLLNAQEPTQQFVTSDETSAAPSAAETPAGTASSGAPVIPPAPVLVPGLPPAPAPSNAVIPAPSSTTAIGLNAIEQPSENPFVGGIDTIPAFLSCKQTVISMCQRTKNVVEFQDCSKRLKIAACKQFFAFEKITGMAPKDDIDLVKYYKDGGLDLIHMVRFGANYPGVYYAIGTSGDFVDLIFGPQTQKLDIRKDPHYPEIALKFPNVELFSIVDKLPQVDSNPNGTGIRLIFRFQLLNGCHACERAGYANVAYDFSDTGVLQAASILSLEPAS